MMAGSKMVMRWRLVGIAALTVMVSLGSAAAMDLTEHCVKVRPAFVFIAGGSGVIVRSDGLMLTNDHVIGSKRSFTVRIGDGRSFRARVLGRDPHGDLAALALELPEGETVPALALGDSEALRVGDEALAVGNPFALGLLDQDPTFTVGVISALHHTQGTYTECIVTDAELNPGNSGGPLLNMAGEVVGINGQISTRFGLRSNTGLGFAISSRQIRLWLPRLEAAGGDEVRHARLAGLDFTAVDRKTAESVIVLDVADGSHAAEAGFRGGHLFALQRLPVEAIEPLVRLHVLGAVLERAQPARRADGEEAIDEVARHRRQVWRPRHAALDDLAVALHGVVGDERRLRGETLEG